MSDTVLSHRGPQTTVKLLAVLIVGLLSAGPLYMPAQGGSLMKETRSNFLGGNMTGLELQGQSMVLSKDSALTSWDLQSYGRPPGAQGPACTHLPDGHMLIFSGVDPWGSNNVTWSYDIANNSWTDLGMAGAPSPRAFSSMAYHPIFGKAVMFGGDLDPSQFGTKATNETWVFDPKTDK